MDYIVKCYCFKDSERPNLVIPYKTKKAAENRKLKCIESGCYYKVEIVEEKFSYVQ